MAMDPLSDVLNLIRLKGSLYYQTEFAAPWGLEVGKGHFAQFHYVVRGQCWLTVNEEHHQIQAGDIIVFPHNK